MPQMTLEQALAQGGRVRGQQSSAPQLPAGALVSEPPSMAQPMTLDDALKAGGRKVGEQPAFLSFFNRGISRGLTFGMGGDTVADGFRSLGVKVADREPSTLPEFVEETAGTAIGTLPAVAWGGAQVARAGLGKASEIAQTILGPFYRAPVAAVGSDLAAGAAAGAARSETRDMHPALSTTIEATAGMAGGVGAGVVMEGRRQARRAVTEALERLAGSRSTVANMMAPFTRSGARPRAQAQLQQRVADPAAAARQLDGESLGGLTPAQRVGDDNLLALERTLMETNPESAARYRAQMARSEEMLRRAAEELGDSAGLEQRIAQATERAQRRIATLAPDAGPERASEIYHNELMASLRAAKARESALWDVPNVRISTATSRMRFAELEGALSRAQADDMPAVARKLLGHPPKGADEPALLVGPRGETLATSRGALGDTEPVKELHGLYSALREESRAARSVGNYNRARLSDDLAEAVWTDLTGAADAPTTVGAQLAAAREYSRELNQAFRQGDVGRILGYARSGERRVQPTEALEAAMGGRGGAQAAVTVDELRHAAEFGGGDVQAAEGAMQDYLKRRFLLAAHADPDGGFSAPGAERFLKANEQLLGRFPGLQQQLTAAGAEMQSAAALNRSREAAAAAFRSQTPRDTLKRSLHGMTAEDRTAMRGAMIEQALSPSRTPDATGQVPVSGERIQGLLANARTRGAFAEVFSPEELTRLTRIADELAKVQKAQGRLDPTIPGGEVLDPPGMSRVVKTANFLAGTIGARLGSKFGQGTSGASLRTASRGARMAEGEMLGYLNRHATKLVMDATNDPSLYRALMTPMNATGSGGESARSVLSRWVARTQAELGDAGRQVTIPPGVGVMGEQLAAGQEPRMSRTGAQ